MSDAPSVPTAAHDADATPGALLKRERERASLSLQQAAEDLHLDPWIIEAIESNRFLALGAPVYARGHLRKYATRLGVSADDILARYDSLQDRPQEADPIPTAIATPVRPPRRSLKGPMWIALTVIVVGVLGYLAFEILLKSPETPLQVSTAATAPVTEPMQAESTDSAPVPPPATDETAAAPQSEPARAERVAPRGPEQASRTAEQTAPPTAAPVVSASTPAVQVRLEFTGESWAEVYDANGTRLLFGMGTPQRVRTVTGTPPILVILGAASAVSLQVNGEAVVVPRREGRESARFTIDAEGNLR